MKDAVIFDLGNTLVGYFARAEWPGILDQAIEEVTAYLRGLGLLRIDIEELPHRVQAERKEPADHRVKPLEGRLERIFDLTDADLADGVVREMCRRFMRPTFAAARRYEDAIPTLVTLREWGLRTGILSNTPWGSPAELWREEVERHGLTDAVDKVMFCRDTGYRKPAPHGFELILDGLGVAPERALFVGDDPRWDLAGPRAVGIDALLIDRSGEWAAGDEPRIRDLTELFVRLQAD